MRKGIGHEIGKRRVPDHTKTAPRGVKTPQDAPRPRSWSQLGPKRGPKIDPKSIKIRTCEPPKTQDPPETPPRYQNGPQNGFQIVAKSTSKSIQNSFNTDAKCACKLFLRHRRHGPTLKKTLCHTPFLAYGILGRSPCHPAAAEGAKLGTITPPKLQKQPVKTLAHGELKHQAPKHLGSQ